MTVTPKSVNVTILQQAPVSTTTTVPTTTDATTNNAELPARKTVTVGTSMPVPAENVWT